MLLDVLFKTHGNHKENMSSTVTIISTQKIEKGNKAYYYEDKKKS